MGWLIRTLETVPTLSVAEESRFQVRGDPDDGRPMERLSACFVGYTRTNQGRGEAVSGHEMQPRDEEIAICHVCGERFSAQQELLTHLRAGVGREGHRTELLTRAALIVIARK
jgi:hypothetical protein